ncbi:Sir2 family histone deacetylase Hst4 [Pyricularia oryzae]|nr:Sir2 family histone deacetylase Hst4 [Pyricularia oryzae]KAI7931128.1 Sir2 family histone deacetylase Hst4 [Pyricularia oryzae]
MDTGAKRSSSDCLSSSPLSSLASSQAPSSPLTVLSNSPSPPTPSPPNRDASSRYPSPSTSSVAISSGSASPMNASGPTPPSSDRPVEASVCTDGPPPAKRRKVQQKRERKTEYLDLDKTGDEGYQDELLARLTKVLRKKKRIVIIAGAGISVSAGIPDFRSQSGLFKSNGKHLFDVSVYHDDSLTSAFHKMVRELATKSQAASPTPFHHMMASIAQEGRLLRLYTQNIDCLDTGMEPLRTSVPLKAAQKPWPKTIQLHGGLAKMQCTKCGDVKDLDPELFDGPKPPLCAVCEEADQIRVAFANKRSRGIGRLRPRMVLYNEASPESEEVGTVSAADLARVPDAVIVVGTTLKIPGVKRLVTEMCRATRSRRDGFTAFLSVEPPQGAEFQECWDIVVRGKCDDVAAIVGLPRYDEPAPTETDWKVTQATEESKKTQAKVSSVNIQKPKVVSAPEPEAKSKKLGQLVDKENGSIPTPNASPKLEATQPNTGTPTTLSLSDAKQTKLQFGQRKKLPGAPTTKTVNKRTRLPDAPQPSKTTKSKIPVKKAAKKDATKKAVKAQPVLTKAFKATKPIITEGKQILVKQEPSPVPSSPVTPDEELFHKLPSLRPGKPLETTVITETATPDDTRPSSRMSVQDVDDSPLHDGCQEMHTISPTSKPRSMGHLID